MAARARAVEGGLRGVALLLSIQAEELRLVGEDLLVDVLDQAAPLLEVAGELVDELLEALAPLRAGGVLVGGRDRNRRGLPELRAGP